MHELASGRGVENMIRADGEKTGEEAREWDMGGERTDRLRGMHTKSEPTLGVPRCSVCSTLHSAVRGKINVQKSKGMLMHL